MSEYRMPAEWEPHRAVWVAWPSDGSLWEENLDPAQRDFTAMCEAIADLDSITKEPRGELLEILVDGEQAERDAVGALGHCKPGFHRIPYGDIWLRDTAPIFVRGSGGLFATRFRFNGWGEKYVLPYDDQIANRITEVSGKGSRAFDWILEGGAVEVDGGGTCLTTRSCLLNPNRETNADSRVMERRLEEALGVSKVLWLEEGLLHDHTDGHIDTLARFVAPGVVVCMKPSGSDDPNRQVLQEISRALRSFSDALGRKLEVVEIPSPGRVLDEDGEIMPASYANFFIANRVVVVPTYGTAFDDEAVESVARLFPNRRTVGVASKAILSGGGALHCITQQEPK